ncbi:MAG: hypothetical protein ACPGWR_27455, partial [Ardenticatenaceae bacterium]
ADCGLRIADCGMKNCGLRIAGRNCVLPIPVRQCSLRAGQASDLRQSVPHACVRRNMHRTLACGIICVPFFRHPNPLERAFFLLDFAGIMSYCNWGQTNKRGKEGRL